ncbi:hypothetical protein ABWH96_20655 [Marivirga tractuosa]|uniref:hypothetical protein n=1 Tax=Marivirga tractuosa TaxID=1006 RepID=UPI0035CEADA3
MRYTITFFILIIFGCSSKPNKEDVVDLEDAICEEEIEQAFKLLKKDTVQYVLINEIPRYERELRQVLSESNIQLELVASMHGEGYCQKSVMDSVINERFGSNYLMLIKNQADSLFLATNRGSVFPEQQLDERPLLATNPNFNGQEEIIKRLNKKTFAKDSIELISNIVNAPYFVVSFIVNKDGESSNAEITERNATDDYMELENVIINEINGLTDWTAGKIRNEIVSSKIEVAIAVNDKRNANTSYE